MSDETKSILIGGLALLIGAPLIWAVVWLVWTYWWTNIIIWVALAYMVRNYDSTFRSNKSWWITKKQGKNK